MSKITIKNLSKVFGDKKALDNVSITFPSGQITGLIGFNGSGKTTTFNILSRFIEKYKGEILVDDKPIDRKTLNTISYLAAGAEPKNPMKVMTHLRDIASLYGVSKKDADVIIKKYSAKMDFDQFLNKPIKSLSKGNQQKIKVISSLLNPNMKILFLNEPFDGLDPLMVKKIEEIFLSLKDITIILTSHRMEVVQEMCAEFFVLKDGKLIASKRTDDESVMVSTNMETSMTPIKKLKYVKKIFERKGQRVILIESDKYSKELQILLLKDKKCTFTSLKDKNLAEEVFEGYGV